ncbi:unnamed protein product, partial [Discosporangium mesarthrocarpum]
ILTREFIAQSLYNRGNGYFTNDVINDLSKPLDFRHMLGRWHYRVALKQAYDSKPSAWMTPVEIFAPHFSNAVANHIVKEAQKQGASPTGGGVQELVLYEVGGGTGTNALHVLNWLKERVPHLYARTEYTIVEISARLADRQRARVCSLHENCHVVNADMLEWGKSGSVEHRPCFVMGFEVLDNLPHDKVAWARPSLSGAAASNDGGQGQGHSQSPELCEAVVVKRAEGGWVEKLRPLQDPLIRKILDLCPDLLSGITLPHGGGHSTPPEQGGSLTSALQLGALQGALFSGHALGMDHYHHYHHQAVFVPTGALLLLATLRDKMPRHHAILADYDSFPPPDLEGVAGGERARTGTGGTSSGGGGGDVCESLLAQQAPLVSSRDPATGVTTDFGTYTVPVGSADIYFPTDFERLARMHAAMCGPWGQVAATGACPGAGAGAAAGAAAGAGAGAGGRVGGFGVAGSVMKQGKFMAEHGEVGATRTLTGFDPLVEDFSNTSIFL